MKIVQRIRAWRIRRSKRTPERWLQRWQAACNHFWHRFARMPKCEASMRWAERNNARLIRLHPPRW